MRLDQSSDHAFVLLIYSQFLKDVLGWRDRLQIFYVQSHESPVPKGVGNNAARQQNKVFRIDVHRIAGHVCSEEIVGFEVLAADDPSKVFVKLQAVALLLHQLKTRIACLAMDSVCGFVF